MYYLLKVMVVVLYSNTVLHRVYPRILKLITADIICNFYHNLFSPFFTFICSQKHFLLLEYVTQHRSIKNKSLVVVQHLLMHLKETTLPDEHCLLQYKNENEYLNSIWICKPAHTAVFKHRLHIDSFIRASSDKILSSIHSFIDNS